MPVPYQNLYIYLLEGYLSPAQEIDCGNFIGNWEEGGYSFLFFSSPSSDIVEEIINGQSRVALLDTFNFTYEEWYGGMPKPFQAGAFFITPPWEGGCEIEAPSKGMLPIALDPGVVFGSGTHPTTRSCLSALELAFCEAGIESVLDLGTGTGVLAIAAARLGANSVIAVDTNFLAVKTAKKNITLNFLEDRALAIQGKAENFIDIPADLVIANVHYDVVNQIINSDGFFRKKRFILSGLLRSQARDVEYRLSQHPVKIIEKWEHDTIWHTYFGGVC